MFLSYFFSTWFHLCFQSLCVILWLPFNLTDDCFLLSQDQPGTKCAPGQFGVLMYTLSHSCFCLYSCCYSDYVSKGGLCKQLLATTFFFPSQKLSSSLLILNLPLVLVLSRLSLQPHWLPSFLHHDSWPCSPSLSRQILCWKFDVSCLWELGEGSRLVEKKNTLHEIVDVLPHTW